MTMMPDRRTMLGRTGIMAAGLVVMGLTSVALGCGTQDDGAVEPVGVFEALGWAPERVAAMLPNRGGGGQARKGGGPRGLHIDLVLHDAQGKYLANRPVRVEWEGGGSEMTVDRSGVLHLDVDRDRRNGLKVLAPVPYTVLQQRSHSGLPGFVTPPELPPIFGGLVAGGLVVDDRNYRDLMGAGLNRMGASGPPTSAEVLKSQRDERTSCVLTLPEVPGAEAPAWTAPQIVAKWRDSVVIVGVYNGQGGRSEASGVVIAEPGVIATNCHVIDAFDNPRALAGVVTRDGRFYPVVEVLAADPASDVALLRVGLEGQPAGGAPLVPAPLSLGDNPGEPLTVISHPNGKFYWVSEGILSRYAREESLGRSIVVMSLTADYAVGSSGAPVFNSRGAVAGLAARTSNVGTQLVFKEGPPALAIRALIRTP
jgi:S1-C subfamily serine protease